MELLERCKLESRARHYGPWVRRTSVKPEPSNCWIDFKLPVQSEEGSCLTSECENVAWRKPMRLEASHDSRAAILALFSKHKRRLAPFSPIFAARYSTDKVLGCHGHGKARQSIPFLRRPFRYNARYYTIPVRGEGQRICAVFPILSSHSRVKSG